MSPLEPSFRAELEDDELADEEDSEAEPEFDFEEEPELEEPDFFLATAPISSGIRSDIPEDEKVYCSPPIVRLVLTRYWPSS